MASFTFIAPLLPVLADEPPDGDGWLHEIKHDGYRTQVHVRGGEGRAFTRNGHDWSDRYRLLINAALQLPCQSAIIDGELIVQDETGRSDFHALRGALAREPHRLVLMAFDLLELDGEDLRSEPLERRRELLLRLISDDQLYPIQFSGHMTGDGFSVLEAADAMGLEGVVSKRLGSKYGSGRSRSWLKCKTFMEEELTVIGTERGDAAPVALLAREEGGELRYAGGAMITLPQPERDRFWAAVEALSAPRPPIAMEKRKASWVWPELRVRVRTLRGEEKLRHATVQAIAELPG